MATQVTCRASAVAGPDIADKSSTDSNSDASTSKATDDESKPLPQPTLSNDTKDETTKNPDSVNELLAPPIAKLSPTSIVRGYTKSPIIKKPRQSSTTTTGHPRNSPTQTNVGSSTATVAMKAAPSTIKPAIIKSEFNSTTNYFGLRTKPLVIKSNQPINAIGANKSASSAASQQAIEESVTTTQSTASSFSPSILPTSSLSSSLNDKVLPASTVSALASQLIISTFTTATQAVSATSPQVSLDIPLQKPCSTLADVEPEISSQDGSVRVKKSSQSRPRYTIKYVDVDSKQTAIRSSSQKDGSKLHPTSPNTDEQRANNGSSVRLLDMGRKLLEASRAGRTSEVKKLVVANGAPFVSDWLGTTALHLAAQNGHLEITDILLKGGVNKDARTKLERTPLHLASQAGHLEVVDLLIESGCEVNAEDMLMMTPIHWAVERGHLIVVERLLTGGANLTSRNKFGLTPIDIAQKIPNYAIISLLDRWLRINSHTNNGLSYNYVSANNFINSAAKQNGNTNNCNGLNATNIIDSLMLNTAYANTAIDINFTANNQVRPMTTTNLIGDTNASNGNHLIGRNSSTLPTIADHSLNTAGANGCNTDEDMLDLDYHLALIDTTSNSHNSGLDVNNPLDLVEFEWDELEDLEPDLFLAAPDSESPAAEQRVSYLMKIVEELQQENQQLRHQVDQLSGSP